MEVTIAVAGEITEKRAVIVKRAKLARVVLRGMVRSEVDDHLDPILMGGSDEIVKLGPRIARVAKVFFNTLEVAGLITVIGSRGISARRRECWSNCRPAGNPDRLTSLPAEIQTFCWIPARSPPRKQQFVSWSVSTNSGRIVVVLLQSRSDRNDGNHFALEITASWLQRARMMEKAARIKRVGVRLVAHEKKS